MGSGAGTDADSTGLVPASVSTITCDAGVDGGELPNGLTVFLSGISIGISTEMGRGWLSNSNGNPMTPSKTSTDAPIKRCRARVRMASTLSGAGTGVEGSSPRFRNLKNAMDEVIQEFRCLASSRGTPCESTPPTVWNDPKTTILSAGSAATMAACSARTGSA